MSYVNASNETKADISYCQPTDRTKMASDPTHNNKANPKRNKAKKHKGEAGN